MAQWMKLLLHRCEDQSCILSTPTKAKQGWWSSLGGPLSKPAGSTRSKLRFIERPCLDRQKE